MTATTDRKVEEIFRETAEKFLGIKKAVEGMEKSVKDLQTRLDRLEQAKINSNTVFPDMGIPEFRKIKEILNQRFSLIKRPTQEGIYEAFIIDSPEGKISFRYYEKGKLMIQSSPSNSDYVSIVDEISKSLSKDPKKQYQNDKLIPLDPTKKELHNLPKPNHKSKKLACYRCKGEIYFDSERKSEKGKLIPLDPTTDEPHDCPKSKYKPKRKLGS